MSVLALDARSRWVVAAVAATLMLAGLLFLFRFPPPATPLPAVVAPSARSAVQIARPDETDALLREEAQLRDLRPLFLPTARNAALPEPRMESSPSLLDNETLKLAFSDTEAQVSKELPPVVKIAGKRVDAITAPDGISMAENGLSAAGMGRRDVAVQAEPARGGHVAVVSQHDGRTVLSVNLPLEARPPGEKSWSPLEFIAVVDAAGLASPLVAIEGSRVEEVDVYFRNYLAQNFRLGERLLPGFYRIVVAP